jgi:hypothetical protein
VTGYRICFTDPHYILLLKSLRRRENTQGRAWQYCMADTGALGDSTFLWIRRHACDQLEFLNGLADFCEDWVEQLHQLGWKNNRRTRMICNRGRKHKLYTQWEQLSGNRNVQRKKKKVNEDRKQKLQHNRGAYTEAPLLNLKTYHREAALEQDNLQWIGENRLLSPQEIIRLCYATH